MRMTTEPQLTFPQKWNQRFMAMAKHVATWSKDPSTQVGCIIVGPKKEIRSTGYNGFPRGVDDNPERYDNRAVKYAFIEHAERNAIFNATLYNASLDGCVMYVTLPSCPDCARSIIQTGIKEVIAMAAPASRSQNTPGWDDAISTSKAMFRESGVNYYEMPNPINRQYNIDYLFESDELNNLSRRLINKNGFAYQATICMEEITELMTELLLDNSFENLASETADVIITMNHIIVGYDIWRPVHDIVIPTQQSQQVFQNDVQKMIALLDWQKELIKNINRGKNNMDQVIKKTALARVALAADIIDRWNLSAVQHHKNQKINRTIERNFGTKSK